MPYFYDNLESVSIIEKAPETPTQVLEEAILRDVTRRFEKPFFIKELEYQAGNDTLYISFRRGGDYKYVGLVKHNGERLVRNFLRANASKETVSKIFHEDIRLGGAEYTRVDVSPDYYDEKEED